MEENRINSVGETADTIGGEKIWKPHISAASVTKVLIQGPIKRNTKNCSRKNTGIHCEGHQQGKYTGRYAYFHYGKGNPGFLKHFSRDRQDWMLLWDMVVIPVIC